MKGEILETIMYHTIQMDRITQISKSIYQFSLQDKIDSATESIQNRDRLVNIISEIQAKACDQISNLSSSNINSDELKVINDIVESWNKEVQSWIAKVERIDQEITKVLEFQKEKTSRQISTIFKSKESFKGYNLSSVR